jgi:hypothetical protein
LKRTKSWNRKVEGRGWRIEQSGERGGKEGEENVLFNARKMG